MIFPKYYSSQFSQVIVVSHFSRKSQNKKFLDFHPFAAFIDNREMSTFVRLSSFGLFD